MKPGDIFLCAVGAMYMVAALAYASSGQSAMAVVMACYGVSQYALVVAT
jgi:hypothetical protein